MGSFIRIMAWTWLALAVMMGVVSWMVIEDVTAPEITQQEGEQEEQRAQQQILEQQKTSPTEQTTPKNRDEQEDQRGLAGVQDPENRSNEINETKQETKQDTQTSETQRSRKYTYLIDLDSVRNPYCKKLEKEFVDKQQETEREIRSLKAAEKELKQDIIDQQEQVEIARSLVEEDPQDYNKRALQTEKKRFVYFRDELKKVQDQIERKEMYLRQVRQTLGAVRRECDRLHIAEKRV